MVRTQPQNQNNFTKQQLLKIQRPPNIPQHQLSNSFSGSPVFTQIIAYILFFGQISVYFVCIDPVYRNIPLLIIYVFLTFVALGSTFIASIMDPTDQIMYIHKWEQHFQNDQNKNKCDQVTKQMLQKVNRYRKFKDDQEKRHYEIQIQQNNQPQIKQLTNLSYCIHCSNYCSLKAKHCKKCQRCVRKFDHHCIWINNCIGQKNYTAFIVMIISVFLHMSVFLTQGVVMSAVQAQNLNDGVIQRKIISWVYMGVILIFTFLLLNLVALHVYLIYTGQTTYDFLVSMKNAQQKKLKEAQQAQRTLQIQIQLQNQAKMNQRQQSNVKLNQENVFNEGKSLIINKKEIKDVKTFCKISNNLEQSSQVIFIQPFNNLYTFKANQSAAQVSRNSKLSHQNTKIQKNSESQSVKQIPCQKVQSYKFRSSNQQQKQERQFPAFFAVNKSLKIILGDNQASQSIPNRPSTTRVFQQRKTQKGLNTSF